MAQPAAPSQVTDLRSSQKCQHPIGLGVHKTCQGCRLAGVPQRVDNVVQSVKSPIGAFTMASPQPILLEGRALALGRPDRPSFEKGGARQPSHINSLASSEWPNDAPIKSPVALGASPSAQHTDSDRPDSDSEFPLLPAAQISPLADPSCGTPLGSSNTITIESNSTTRGAEQRLRDEFISRQLINKNPSGDALQTTNSTLWNGNRSRRRKARHGKPSDARPRGLAAHRGNTEGVLPSDRKQPQRRRSRQQGNPVDPLIGTSTRWCGEQQQVVIASQNIDGVTDVKLVALFSYMKKHDVDIMHLQETKSQDPFPEWAFHHGYKIIHEAPAHGSRSGGCATLVKQKWHCKQLRTLPDEGDVCWTEVTLGHEKLVSANVYWRTSSQCSISELETLASDVSDRLRSKRDAEHKVLLCGDLNTDDRRCGRNTVGGPSVDDTARALVIKTQLHDTGAYRVDLQGGLADQPTRLPWQAGERAWHIDALALDERWKQNVTSYGIDNDCNEPLVASSDHHPIWCSLRLRTTPLPKTNPPIVYKVKAATAEQWARATAKLSVWAEEFLPRAQRRVQDTSANRRRRQRVTDDINKEINTALHRTYEKCIGTHKVRLNGSPFWSPSLTALSTKAKRHARDAYTACKRGEVAASQDHASAAKKLRKDVKHTIRKLTRRANLSAATDAEKGDLTRTWKITNQLKPGVTGALGDSCVYNGKSYDSQSEVNAALTRKMADVHTYRAHDPRYDQSFHDEVTSAMPELLRENHDTPLNEKFTSDELDVVLKKLKGRETKQPGPDGIKYWMLTKGGESLKEVVLWFYNLLWDWETVPREWHHAHIRYLHKGGTKPKFDLSSYRPISLISCIGKAYTMLWLPRLEKQLRPHLPTEQSGFMPKSGSVEALWTIRALVDTHVNAESGNTRTPANRAYACFADTATAFDTVWRDGLYFILYSYGVRGKMLRMIKAWHDSATAIGLWYTAQSNRIQFSQGVRQGCVIAPLLYVCFVSPLMGRTPPKNGHGRPDLLGKAFDGGLDERDGLECMAHATRIAMSAALYVDDVCLLSPSAVALQRNLTRYEAYATKWRYQLNADKFHVVAFGKKSRIGNESLTVTDQQGQVKILTDEKSAEYLGAHVDNKLSGKAQLAATAAKAKKHAPLLSRLSSLVGEFAAAAVQEGKVEPACMYGVAAMAVPAQGLEGLDAAVTEKCLKRTHRLPRRCRSEIARYQRPTLWASSKARLEEMALFLKLKSDPHSTRTALLHHAASDSASGPVADQYRRAQALAEQCGGTCRPGSARTSKRKRKRMAQEAKAVLLREQQEKLRRSLPLRPTAGTVGRGSAALFNATIHPVGNPSQYADSKRFGVISDPRDRKAVTQLRTGQVDCAVERRKWNSRGALECSCGCLVGDPYHTVMECPHTYANRLAVYDRIREHAASDSDLGGLLAHTMDSVLLASLGALLPGEGAAPDAPLYTTLIRSAAPAWAKAFDHVLNQWM